MQHRVEMVNRLCGRISICLGRGEPDIPRHLRMIAVGFVREWMRQAIRGHAEIHPGNDKIGQWGGVKRRQAIYDVRQLENWGVLQRVAYPNGGRRATRFYVDVNQLIRVMQTMGCNPSQALVTEVRDCLELITGSREKQCKKPCTEPCTGAPGILYVPEAAIAPSVPSSPDTQHREDEQVAQPASVNARGEVGVLSGKRGDPVDVGTWLASVAPTSRQEPPFHRHISRIHDRDAGGLATQSPKPGLGKIQWKRPEWAGGERC